MTRLQMRHHDDARLSGLGLAGLAVGLVAGLAAGAYIAHRLGGTARIPVLSRRRRSNQVPDHPDSDVVAVGAADVQEEDDLYAEVDDSLDDGDDWDDEDAAAEEGDLYADDSDDDDTFSSADPELEDRVLEAFTNDPILSERAVDIGAIRPATIELIGTVFTDEELDYATTLTGGVPGVESVVNRLVVREADDRRARTKAEPVDGTTRPPEPPPAH
jgi:hypothetical protein